MKEKTKDKTQENTRNKAFAMACVLMAFTLLLTGCGGKDPSKEADKGSEAAIDTESNQMPEGSPSQPAGEEDQTITVQEYLKRQEESGKQVVTMESEGMIAYLSNYLDSDHMLSFSVKRDSEGTLCFRFSAYATSEADAKAVFHSFYDVAEESSLDAYAVGVTVTPPSADIGGSVAIKKHADGSYGYSGSNRDGSLVYDSFPDWFLDESVSMDQKEENLLKEKVRDAALDFIENWENYPYEEP